MYMYLPVSRQLMCREINISMNLASVECTPILCLPFLPYNYGAFGPSGFYTLYLRPYYTWLFDDIILSLQTLMGKKYFIENETW